MTQGHIYDLKDPWPLGQPEIEIHTFLKQSSGLWEDGICSGAEMPGEYYFDMNSTAWYGNVTLATENFIGESMLQFQVWEDDNDPCTQFGGRPPKTTSDIQLDLIDFSTRIINVYVNQPQPPHTELKWIATLGSLIRPTLSVVSSLQKDDFIGLLEGPVDGCWPRYNDPVFPIRDHAGMGRGWASLDVTYGEKTPLCAETSVELSGPVNVCLTASPPQFQAYAQGAGPFQYTWYIDGSSVYGATTDTFEWVNRAHGSYVIKVEILDQGSMIMVSDQMTTYINNC